MNTKERTRKELRPPLSECGILIDGYWYEYSRYGRSPPKSEAEVVKCCKAYRAELLDIARAVGAEIQSLCEGEAEAIERSGLRPDELKGLFRGTGLEYLRASDDLFFVYDREEIGCASPDPCAMLEPSRDPPEKRCQAWSKAMRAARGDRSVEEISALKNLPTAMIVCMESGACLMPIARLADLLDALERARVRLEDYDGTLAKYVWDACWNFNYECL